MNLLLCSSRSCVLILVALPLLSASASTAVANDPCSSFLENHLGEEEHLDACLKWMSELQTTSTGHPAASFAGLPSQTASSSTATMTAETHLNISEQLGSEQEVEIWVNPLDPNQIFALANNEPLGTDGMFVAFSHDGGDTWLPPIAPPPPSASPEDRKIADGTDGLPLAIADPAVRWDEFGNLFIGYISPPTGKTAVLIRSDNQPGNELDFTDVRLLGGAPPNETADRPTIVTGSGSVWVSYRPFGGQRIYAETAPVTGLGIVGSFTQQSTPNGGQGAPSIPDIAMGPEGQVLVSHQTESAATPGIADIYVALDPDGTGPAPLSQQPDLAVETLMTHQNHLTLAGDAFAHGDLQFDVSRGPFRGRAYLIYTDVPAPLSHDTNIFVRYSTDNGEEWHDCSGIPVNDDATTTTQLLPRLSVDPVSGVIAASWHDARNDPTGNKKTEFYAAISVDGCATFSPNVKIGLGQSEQPGPPTGSIQDYGDYTGLVFYRGVFHSAWGDNSNCCEPPPGTNPDGTHSHNDVYTARVATDSDGDGVLDRDDNCILIANAPPLDCDTDQDGYGNACDGDFDNSSVVDATDFLAPYFLTDFQSGTDSGIGSDMNCSGGVDATDFLPPYFVDQFTLGAPGPSGLDCAGTTPCP